MLTAKEAVEVAQQSYKELLGIDKGDELSLEEIELSDDGKYWLVTLGHSTPLKDPKNLMLSALGTRFITTYKTIKIDTEKGMMHALKDRQL